jgi:FAD:protein FMN transferase
MELTRRQWLKGTGSLFAAAGGLSLALPASGHHRQLNTLGGAAFGSYWRAIVPRGANEGDVRERVEAIVRSVDQCMSPFHTGTEVSRFNGMSSGKSLPVSRPFQAVVAESLRIADLSGGAFDPTVGPLVNRYGFGPIKGDADASFDDIAIGNGRLSKAKPNVTLDLCGIAKGYALDEIARALDRLGIRDFVVELGGEVIARGSHPRGRPWHIAVEAPIPGTSTAQRIVRLDGQALATSGDRTNGYTLGGKRYSHVMNPRLAAPADDRIASVSVIAHGAMKADAFATAILALGPEKGSEFALSQHIPTLILLRDGKGIREMALAGFRERIEV